MKFLLLTRTDRWRWCRTAWFLLAALLIGCGREEIRVYKVPKEKAEAFASASGVGESNQRHLDWKLPDGWREQPSQGSMRMATFAIAGKQGQQANVAVIALAAGRDFEVINILRDGVGLPPLDEDGLAKLAEGIQIGPSRGKLFDMETGNSSVTNTGPRRILVAVLPDDDRSWFFSMSGEDAFVREQKPVFLQFLQSVSFHEGGSHSEPFSARPPISTNVKEVPSTATGLKKNVWNAPSNWQEVPPTQSLLAKFLATGDAGTRAEITISVLPRDGGGVLANVNRWRGQIRLALVEQTELEKLVSALDVSSGKAMLVDMTGNKSSDDKSKRLIGAIVPQGGRTWFYKMLGDEPVVAREKEAFIKFVQTVTPPDVP